MNNMKNKNTGFFAYEGEKYICDVPNPDDEEHGEFVNRLMKDRGIDYLDVYKSVNGRAEWVSSTVICRSENP